MSGSFTEDSERGSAATAGNKTSLDERHRAALYVCSRAADKADATDLLHALGLLDPGFRWTSSGPHAPRKKVTE